MRGALYRARSAWQHLTPNARGAVWVSLGTVLSSFNDALIKLLGQSVDPIEMTFFRYAIGCVLMLPVVMHVGIAGMRTRRLGWHLFRASTAALAQVCVYYGVTHLLLADATALAFSRLLFSTVLAAVVLHEAVNRRRWTATIAGFLGVLVVLRPGESAIDVAALVAIAGALIFAAGMVAVPKLATTDSPTQIIFYNNVLSVVFIAVPTLIIWRTPDLREFLFLLAIGALTTVSINCFIRGFAVGETSVVAPMEYARIIYATIIGFIVFGELPDGWTGVGALIIIGSTLYIARRETRARKAAREAAP